MATTTSTTTSQKRSVSYPNQVSPRVSKATNGLVGQLDRAAKNRIPRQ